MIVSKASHSTIAKSNAPPNPARSLIPVAALAAPLLRGLLPLRRRLLRFRPGRLLLGLGFGSRFVVHAAKGPGAAPEHPVHARGPHVHRVGALPSKQGAVELPGGLVVRGRELMPGEVTQCGLVAPLSLPARLV